ncbi:MAG: hypothetical protein K2Q33_00970 [Gammaproteobacteria bacterium]|nr:hypothetical protein [Gammaproteobacteria bacterium]
MASNTNELRFYNDRSPSSGETLYYWTNILSDGMHTTPCVFPPLELNSTDGILTVKMDDNKRLYYSYATTNPDGSGKSGRFYVFVSADGSAPTFSGEQPAPEDPSFYNIFEFTDTSTAGNPAAPVWVDLTAVDSTGVPLALTGTAITGAAFQLGYAKSAEDIVSDLSAIAGPSAIVKTNGDMPRILSPVHAPEAYRSFDPYLQELAQRNTQISILSDIVLASTANGETIPAENNEQPLEFVGGFTFDDEKGGVMLTLSGIDYTGQKWTVVIPGDQLTTANIYGCAGGTLTVQSEDGSVQTRDQNDNNPNDPLCLIINSVFREVCKGLNEGKLKPATTQVNEFARNNINMNFNFLPPFQVTLSDGSIAGNPYVHYFKQLSEVEGKHALNASAYTYPYDDGAALAQTQGGSSITVYMGSDAQKPFYPTIGIPHNNAPSLSYPTYTGAGSRPEYRLAIGANSQDLGSIWVGDVCYLPTADGAYNIILAHADEYTPITFVHQDGSRSCIWVSTPFSAPSPLSQPAPSAGQNIIAVDAQGNSCLTQGGTPIDPSRYTFSAVSGTNIWHLDLGANIGWNRNAKSPKNPNTSVLGQTKEAKSDRSRCCGWNPRETVENALTTGERALSVVGGAMRFFAQVEVKLFEAATELLSGNRPSRKK